MCLSLIEEVRINKPAVFKKGFRQWFEFIDKNEQRRGSAVCIILIMTDYTDYSLKVLIKNWEIKIGYYIYNSLFLIKDFTNRRFAIETKPRD